MLFKWKFYPQIYWLIILSIVVASIAWTVTQEEIFREPREFCEKKSENCKSIFKENFFMFSPANTVSAIG
jgi:hypothetical protein